MYKTVDKTGSLTVHFRFCWMDKQGTHMIQVDKVKLIFLCLLSGYRRV
jgi:hypothetical protein